MWQGLKEPSADQQRASVQVGRTWRGNVPAVPGGAASPGRREEVF